MVACATSGAIPTWNHEVYRHRGRAPDEALSSGAPWQAPVVAVDGVSFRVGVGEVFGFLGPNGAGKTTTVHMLTTLIRASGGRAAVLGEDVERNPLAVRRVIGIVPEVSNVYEEYSAWDNLIFTARLSGVGRAVRAERAQELLSRFDLWDRRASRAAGSPPQWVDWLP